MSRIDFVNNNLGNKSSKTVRLVDNKNMPVFKVRMKEKKKVKFRPTVEGENPIDGYWETIEVLNTNNIDLVGLLLCTEFILKHYKARKITIEAEENITFERSYRVSNEDKYSIEGDSHIV